MTLCFALQFAGAAQQSGAECGAAEAFEDGRPDDQIGDPGLVLDGDEDDAVGAARDAGGSTRSRRSRAGGRPAMGEVGGGDEAFAGKFRRRKASGWRFRAKPEAGVILDDLLAQRHLRQQCHGAGFAVRCGASSGEVPLTLPSPAPDVGRGFSL